MQRTASSSRTKRRTRDSALDPLIASSWFKCRSRPIGVEEDDVARRDQRSAPLQVGEGGYAKNLRERLARGDPGTIRRAEPMAHALPLGRGCPFRRILGLGCCRLLRCSLHAGRDPGAPCARGREHARVLDRLEPRRRHARCQATEERERIHVDRDGAVGVGALESDAHQAVGPHLEPVLREWGTKHIAKERFAPCCVERTRARRRVQREAVESGAERLVEREPARRERRETAQPLWPRRRRLGTSVGASGQRFSSCARTWRRMNASRLVRRKRFSGSRFRFWAFAHCFHSASASSRQC